MEFVFKIFIYINNIKLEKKSNTTTSMSIDIDIAFFIMNVM